MKVSISFGVVFSLRGSGSNACHASLLRLRRQVRLSPKLLDTTLDSHLNV